MTLIGRLQRQHIADLQALQPGRPILVQPLRSVSGLQKGTRWVGIDEVPEGQELWTRSILAIELLFDCDAKTWAEVAENTAHLVETLQELEIPYVGGPSGGKGTHHSVMIDPESLHAPDALLARAKAQGVDVWSVARLTLAHAILDAMEVPEGDDARWAPPLGAAGVWDRSKIKWTTERSGSMVRLCGTPGSTGARKTVCAWTPAEWRASATFARAPTLPTEFHAAPRLWRVPPELNARIAKAIEETVGQAEAARAKTRVAADPVAAEAKLRAVPCIAHILEAAAPRGTRHYAFLNLTVTAHYLGVPRERARALLLEALTLCGLDETDPALMTFEEVYDGRYSLLNVACPSPHVKAWCCPNQCPLSRKLSF